MKFSMYKSQFDVYPVTSEGEWEDIVQIFIQGQFVELSGNKTNFPHISLSTFDGYKDGEHGLEMSGLILDYDDGMSVEEAIELFREYEFLFYTSYNHQRQKENKDGTTSDPVDKFRLIFPFTETCPYDEWLLRMEYVTTFAPSCDPASKKFVQCYCLPATHPDNIDNTIMFHNRGRLLDWHSFPVTKKDEHHATGAVAKYTSGNKFKPDDVIQLKQGSIVAKDVDRRYQCYCPFHDDKSPGAFVSKSDKGNTYLHCTRCGTAYMECEEDDNDESVSDFLERMREKKVKKENNSRTTFNKVNAVNSLIYENDQAVCIPFPRDKRTQLLAREYKKFGKSRKQYLTLFAFEGYGKSSLAVEESKKGNKVVFGCESNQQAEEQAQSFRDRGCRVQCIVSRDYKLINNYDVEVEYGEQPNPWASRPIKEAATKKNIAVKFDWDKEEVQEFWDHIKPEDNDFHNYDIVVTTHDRISGWGRIQTIREGKAKKEGTLIPVYGGKHGPIIRYTEIKDEDGENNGPKLIPQDAIIFFDDPSYDDFSLLYDFDNKWADKKIDGVSIEVREIDNHKYFVRPKKYLFGYGFTNKIIFSTTELITLELICAGYGRHKVDVPPLMPNEKMNAGHITVMKTERVRKKWDGLLPPIVERLKKDGFEFEYFADGQGNDYNLVTSKGQNIFDGKDTLIEISQPHESKVIKLQHELQWTESDRFAVRVAICLDQMHQAIGRNSGYRWSDKEEYDDRRVNRPGFTGDSIS